MLQCTIAPKIISMPLKAGLKGTRSKYLHYNKALKTQFRTTRALSSKAPSDLNAASERPNNEYLYTTTNRSKMIELILIEALQFCMNNKTGCY